MLKNMDDLSSASKNTLEIQISYEIINKIKIITLDLEVFGLCFQFFLILRFF